MNEYTSWLIKVDFSLLSVGVQQPLLEEGSYEVVQNKLFKNENEKQNQDQPLLLEHQQLTSKWRMSLLRWGDSSFFSCLSNFSFVIGIDSQPK